MLEALSGLASEEDARLQLFQGDGGEWRIRLLAPSHLEGRLKLRREDKDDDEDDEVEDGHRGQNEDQEDATGWEERQSLKLTVLADKEGVLIIDKPAGITSERLIFLVAQQLVPPLEVSSTFHTMGCVVHLLFDAAIWSWKQLIPASQRRALWSSQSAGSTGAPAAPSPFLEMTLLCSTSPGSSRRGLYPRPISRSRGESHLQRGR